MHNLDEAADKEFFDALLARFEKVWENCFQGKSISKSAAFTAFVNVDQTNGLICYFDCAEEADKLDEGDEWKTKQ